jgi:hypothetical protein
VGVGVSAVRVDKFVSVVSPGTTMHQRSVPSQSDVRDLLSGAVMQMRVDIYFGKDSSREFSFVGPFKSSTKTAFKESCEVGPCHVRYQRPLALDKNELWLKKCNEWNVYDMLTAVSCPASLVDAIVLSVFARNFSSKSCSNKRFELAW